MQHDWMIDVLSDLRTFAENHQMGRLAEHLEDSIVMAACEIQGTPDRDAVLGAHEQKDNRIPRTARAS